FGDLLLQEIGPRLSRVLRDNDLMARLGGDEFGIVLPELPSEDVAMRIADRLIEELEIPVSVEGLALDVSGSVGIALFPSQANDAEALLRRADVAMYAAKENGGGYELYDDDMDRHNPARLTLIGQVRPALESGEFVLYYQPKVRLSDGRAAGAEALIRWEHPSLGLLPPDEFIPLVEKTVLLRPLTHHVIETVLRQWREWADIGIRIPIEQIKVDRSFVMQMHVDANDFMIVRATVVLGRNLGLRVVAEGVEDLATFDRLAEFGCDEAQGYYISRPLSAVEFTRWLSVRNLEIDTVRPDGRREGDQRDDPGRERLRVV